MRSGHHRECVRALIPRLFTLEALRTGDGRELPDHLKAQIVRELDRLELLLNQIKAIESERDALVTTDTEPPRLSNAALRRVIVQETTFAANKLRRFGLSEDPASAVERSQLPAVTLPRAAYRAATSIGFDR